MTTEKTATPDPDDETTDAAEADAADTAESDDADTDTDEAAETDADADDAGEAGSGPDPRLLEELDQHIREARAAAEEAFADDPDQTFVESGNEQSEAQDDQTIAPG